MQEYEVGDLVLVERVDAGSGGEAIRSYEGFTGEVTEVSFSSSDHSINAIWLRFEESPNLPNSEEVFYPYDETLINISRKPRKRLWKI